MGLLSQHNTIITAVIAQQRAELVHCICVVGTWIRGCPGVIGTNKPHHPGDKVIAWRETSQPRVKNSNPKHFQTRFWDLFQDQFYIFLFYFLYSCLTLIGRRQLLWEYRPIKKKLSWIRGAYNRSKGPPTYQRDLRSVGILKIVVSHGKLQGEDLL